MLLATLSAFATVGGVTLPGVDPPARSSEAPKLLHSVHRLLAVGADRMALGWRSRRRLNAADGGSDPTFLSGDWRTTGKSQCARVCNRRTGFGADGDTLWNPVGHPAGTCEKPSEPFCDDGMGESAGDIGYGPGLYTEAECRAACEAFAATR